jgi:hypothetical protein
LAAAAAIADPAIRRRGSIRSGRFSRAAATLPVMKPACTATTSHAAPAAAKRQSRSSAGTTAVALNQVELASTAATATRTSACRGLMTAATAGRTATMLATAQPRSAARTSSGPTRQR